MTHPLLSMGTGGTLTKEQGDKILMPMLDLARNSFFIADQVNTFSYGQARKEAISWLPTATDVATGEKPRGAAYSRWNRP